jgi:rubrerythrin
MIDKNKGKIRANLKAKSAKKLEKSKAAKLKIKENKKSIKLKCHRCDYIWNYKGINPFYAQCPFCMTTVVIKNHKV